MSDGVLELNGISEEILSELSYKSKLNISLKSNMHYFPKDELLQELFNMADWYDEQEILSDIPLDYRVKSHESIARKYERYYPDHQVRKVFNDTLGFRAFCDSYRDVLNIKDTVFKIVDMSAGKANDDGYRGVHLYFQLDNRHYPIEIQYNTLYDRQFNNWLHEYVYKKDYPLSVGQKLRKNYENGLIKNSDDFMEALKLCVI